MIFIFTDRKGRKHVQPRCARPKPLGKLDALRQAIFRAAFKREGLPCLDADDCALCGWPESEHGGMPS